VGGASSGAHDHPGTRGSRAALDAHAVFRGAHAGSHFRTVRNTIRSEIDGVLVAQTPERPPEEPSDYLIAQNKISVNEQGLSIVGGANDGVATFDFASMQGLTETMEANVNIWGNDITVGVNVLEGIVIFSDGPGDVRVFGNRVCGEPVEAGIWVEFSAGTFVAGNDLRAIEPPLGDVSLRATSRECIVVESKLRPASQALRRTRRRARSLAQDRFPGSTARPGTATASRYARGLTGSA
jgi:hypothetical protein